MFLLGQCHCGRVKVKLETKPDYVNDCNCSLCRKSGALWGYFHRDQVKVSGPTDTYQRADRDSPVVNIHFCKHCGNTTHWTLTMFGKTLVEDIYRMGANMHLFSVSDLKGVEKRYPNRADWQGGPELDDVKPPELL